jgi:hypothetical protein
MAGILLIDDHVSCRSFELADIVGNLPMMQQTVAADKYLVFSNQGANARLADFTETLPLWKISSRRALVFFRKGRHAMAYSDFRRCLYAARIISKTSNRLIRI